MTRKPHHLVKAGQASHRPGQCGQMNEPEMCANSCDVFAQQGVTTILPIGILDSSKALLRIAVELVATANQPNDVRGALLASSQQSARSDHACHLRDFCEHGPPEADATNVEAKGSQVEPYQPLEVLSALGFSGNFASYNLAYVNSRVGLGVSIPAAALCSAAAALVTELLYKTFYRTFIYRILVL